MSYQHCNGKHDLQDISYRLDGTPGVFRLTRWCANCGAIVIDVDVDGRTHPGHGMPMRFPRIAEVARGVPAIWMPERRQLPEREGSTYFRALGWNECLDEMARRNAGAQACLSPNSEPRRCVMWKCHEAKACARGVPEVAPHPDTVLLDFIASEYLDVSAFAMPTGADDADVGWKLHQEHMGAKGRVEVACHYRDDLRAAIREAMRALGHTLPDGVSRPDGESFPPRTTDGGAA